MRTCMPPSRPSSALLSRWTLSPRPPKNRSPPATHPAGSKNNSKPSPGWPAAQCMLARVATVPPSAFFDPVGETMDRASLADHQLTRLRDLLDEILPANAFYGRKLGRHPRLASLDDLRDLPFTTKSELVDDQAAAPPFGTNLTYPLSQYVKLHQT